MRLFIVVDEVQTLDYTYKTKKLSKQWIANGESAPKKPKTVSFAGKVMAIVFCRS